VFLLLLFFPLPDGAPPPSNSSYCFNHHHPGIIALPPQPQLPEPTSPGPPNLLDVVAAASNGWQHYQPPLIAQPATKRHQPTTYTTPAPSHHHQPFPCIKTALCSCIESDINSHLILIIFEFLELF